MQMTPGNDNLAVWCIRLKSEGTNLIPNGTFGDATGWTQTGDWSITGGEATYTFVDDASGDLTITVAAVSAVAYVLEYEVTTVTQDGFTLSLEGTGSFVSTAEVFLPITLGQHRVIISGKASSTVFRLKARTFGAGDVLKIDNVKFRKLEETTYIATQTLSLTNTWDGQALNFNDRVSDIDSFIDTGSSGTIGGVSAYVFTISRYSDNGKFDGFHEEFYPAFDGGTLSSRDCEIGVVWNTASTDTEITWLMRGRIIDYQYTPRKMILTVLQSTEIDSRPLPYYFIQKDFDNGVSYFANAPEENVGAAIPIVYGEHQTRNLVEDWATFSPGILIDEEKNSVLVASHKLGSIGAGTGLTEVYKSIPSLNTYMTLASGSEVTTNNDIISYHSITDTPDDLTGTMDIVLRAQSSYSGVTGISNVIDADSTNFMTIDAAERLALRVGGTASTADVGWLGVTDGFIILKYKVESGSGTNRDWTMGVNNLNYGTPPNLDPTPSTGTITGGAAATEISHSFAAETGMKKDLVIPWSIEEICNLEYYIINDDVNGGDLIKIYYAKVRLAPIRVSGIGRKYIPSIPRFFGSGRITLINPLDVSQINYEGSTGSGWIKRFRFSRGEEIKAAEQSGLFVECEGREYGRWIDSAGTTGGGTRNENNGSAADPGFAEGDLIETAAYDIESIFRDEVWVERDLQITSSADITHFICSDVISRENDYYNNAELYNATTLVKSYITGYVGSTNTFTINAADGAMAAGNNIYLTNIQGDNRIDIYNK